jgi:hypothetical protein
MRYALAQGALRARVANACALRMGEGASPWAEVRHVRGDA